MDVLIPIISGFASALITNYLGDALPITRSLSMPICNNCKNEFTFMDYILFLPCSHCKTKRGLRAWAVLVAVLALSIYLWYLPPARLSYWLSMLVITYMAVVVVIDAEHRLILHPTSVAGFVVALFAGWYINGITNTLLGGLIGFGIMFFFYYAGTWVTRFRASRMMTLGQEPDDEEALGAGDVILSGILGLALGSDLVLRGIFLGIVLAGLFGFLMIIWMMVARRYKKDVLMIFMPYGPFLIIGTFLLIFIFPTAV